MKLSLLGSGIIFILIIAVAFAGCSGTTTQSAPQSGSSSGQAAATTAAGSAAPAATTASQSAAGGSVTGSSIFGTPTYEWFEYKETMGSGSQAMTIYYKYNIKTGACTMRYEGANLPSGMPTEMDCSSKGTTTTSSGNPNDVASDVKFTKVGTEVVTVPAGTFTADKYTATVSGNTATYWIVSGKPLIKMVSSSSEGSMTMELNGWG